MRGPALALLLAAGLVLGAVPAADASTRLPERCESWFGPGALALICDPAGGSRARLSIETADETARAEADLGIAQLPGKEPFQDGDRIVFSFDGASPATVVAFRAAAGDGVHSLVVAPFDPPARRYEVVIEGEIARVTSDSGQVRTLRINPPAPAPARDATPGAAVRSFVRLMQVDLAAACGLLSPTMRTALSAYEDCGGLLAVILYYEEGDTVPDWTSIEVRRVRVQHGRPTIARVDLIYRFKPRPMRVWATVPLVQEGTAWRIAAPETLGPSKVVEGESDLSRSEVRASLRNSRQIARDVRRLERRRREATRPIATGPTACRGAVRSAIDPERDVTLADGGDVARRQEAAAGVDLIGASQSRVGSQVCFELRFRAPVPAELGLDLRLDQRSTTFRRAFLSDEVRVEIGEGGAVAIRDPIYAPRYLPARATVSPARDAISVQIRDRRGWPDIDPRRRFRSSVEAWTHAPAIDNAYLDELKP